MLWWLGHAEWASLGSGVMRPSSQGLAVVAFAGAMQDTYLRFPALGLSPCLGFPSRSVPGVGLPPPSPPRTPVVDSPIVDRA